MAKDITVKPGDLALAKYPSGQKVVCFVQEMFDENRGTDFTFTYWKRYDDSVSAMEMETLSVLPSHCFIRVFPPSDWDGNLFNLTPDTVVRFSERNSE